MACIISTCHAYSSERYKIYMAQIEYKTVVSWDVALVDVGFADSSVSSGLKGLAINAIKITTGAPQANNGYFIPGALIQNSVDGTLYINSGTTAAAIWSLVDTGNPFALPDAVTDSTTTSGISFAMIMSALTTGTGQKITASATTTGKIQQIVAAAATLAGAGRYVAYNDGALDVFSIGPNGHIHTLQTTAPTVASLVAQGITAAAITAGSTDTAGIITTTGTQNNTADSTITVTFNKTYTTAPKVVLLTAANASAGTVGVNGFYISSITATTFVVGFAKGSACTATPSLFYTVIA
jgi:hypothetical protein